MVTKKELQIERTSREVKIRLSNQELDEKRDEAAEAQRLIDDAQAALDSAQAAFKETKKGFDEAIDSNGDSRSRLLREIREKKAKRLVELDEVHNYETKKIEYWYPKHGKGELVDEREFTTEEHQMRMFQNQADSIPSTGMDPIASELQ